MKYTMVYARRVLEEDIANLDVVMKKRIRVTIERKLAFEPEKFGKHLRKSLRGHRRIRVGDYRVVYRIEDRVVKIFGILHRSVVYQSILQRL